MKRHYSLLNDYYNYLIKRKLFNQNPVRGRKFAREEEFEYKIYSKDEIKKLPYILEGEKIRIAVFLGLLGLRRGEVCGLKWSDIDFDNNKIQIRRSRVKSAEGIVQSTTKSKSSTRSISIPKKFKDELINERTRHKRLKNTIQNFLNEGWVCIYNDGRPLRPDYITKRWKRVIEKSILKHIRFHDLRHSYASFAIANNVPMKVVAENLGHSSIDITVNTYAHVLDEDKEKSADIANKML